MEFSLFTTVIHVVSECFHLSHLTRMPNLFPGTSFIIYIVLGFFFPPYTTSFDILWPIHLIRDHLEAFAGGSLSLIIIFIASFGTHGALQSKHRKSSKFN